MGVDDAVMRGHLATVRASWVDRGAVCNAQLSKFGIGSDECREIEENLFAIGERYAGA
jgi:hypothetical protein